MLQKVKKIYRELADDKNHLIKSEGLGQKLNLTKVK